MSFAITQVLNPRAETNSKVSAIATLSLAVLAVSFAPIFIRFSQTDLGANATVFNRLFIFAVVFGAARGISQRFQDAGNDKTSEPLTWQNLLLLFSVGIVSIVSLVLWAISLEYTTVAKSMVLNNLTPLFTSLGAWLFLGKFFDKKFLAGMAIALLGAIALGLEDLHGLDGSLLGDLYALLSAVFLGTYFLLVEQLRNRFCATTILLWRCVIGSALLLPLVLFTEGQLFPTSVLAWAGAIGLAIVSEGLGQRLLADCMDRLSCSFVSVFLLLEPILSAMLAWVIFAEQLSGTTWVGFAVVLTGIYLAKSSTAATK